MEADLDLALAAGGDLLGKELHSDATDIWRAEDVGEIKLPGLGLRVEGCSAAQQDRGHACGAPRDDAAATQSTDQVRAGLWCRHQRSSVNYLVRTFTPASKPYWSASAVRCTIAAVRASS